MVRLRSPQVLRSGFTLIEILTVLILLGLLSLGVLSVLPDSEVTLSTEADQLRSDLRYAQIRAQADVYQWRLVFTDASTYQIGPVVIPGPGFVPRVVPGSGETQRTMADGITTTPGTAFRFDSWGRALTDAGTLPDQNPGITLSSGTGSERITVFAQTGFIP